MVVGQRRQRTGRISRTLRADDGGQANCDAFSFGDQGGGFFGFRLRLASQASASQLPSINVRCAQSSRLRPRPLRVWAFAKASPKPRQKPKILASQRYIISVNALTEIKASRGKACTLPRLAPTSLW